MYLKVSTADSQNQFFLTLFLLLDQVIKIYPRMLFRDHIPFLLFHCLSNSVSISLKHLLKNLPYNCTKITWVWAILFIPPPFLYLKRVFPCVTRPSHSLAQNPTWPSTHLKNGHNSCVDKHGSIWAVTGLFFSCISVPIPIHQCSCFTGFPLVSHMVPTDRECFWWLCWWVSKWPHGLHGRNEFSGLGEFSSGKMLHLDDMVFFLALPDLSLADVLHEVTSSHFQSVNLSRENCSGEPQRFCLCYSGWETSRVKTRDTVSLEGISAIWCKQGWG